MSAILTVCQHRLGGYSAYGRLTREKIVSMTREYYERQLKEAAAFLALRDDDLDCRIVRGVHVQRLVKKL